MGKSPEVNDEITVEEAAQIRDSFRRVWTVAISAAMISAVPVLILKDSAPWIIVLPILAGIAVGLFLEWQSEETREINLGRSRHYTVKFGLIRQYSSGIGNLFHRLFRSVAEVVGVAICYVDIVWWAMSSFARRLLTSSAIIVILVTCGIVFLEITGEIFRKRIDLIHLPRWLEVLGLLLAFWLLYVCYKEFRKLREESVIATLVGLLFEEIAQLRFVSGKTGNEKVLQDFVHKVLIAFVNLYQSRRQPQVNVMLQANDDRLRIHFVEPPTARYKESMFAAGEGEASIAFNKGVTLYFPAMRYHYGISITAEKYELLEMAYRDSKVGGFGSVISTPILCGGNICGVLNVDSKHRNAFNMTDIRIAQVAASAVGMAIYRYKNSFDVAERISKYVQAVEHPSTTIRFVDVLKMIPKAARQGWNRKLVDRKLSPTTTTVEA